MVESLLKKSWRAIIAKPLRFLYMTTLDILIIAILAGLSYLINILIPNDTIQLGGVQSSVIVIGGTLLALAAYFIISVLVYSFYSLIILGNIKSMSTDHKFDFSMYKNMFGLNMLLIMLLFILLIAFKFILGLLVNMDIYIAAFIAVLMLLMMLFAYVFYNFTHSIFILKHELYHNLKSSLKHTFTRTYIGVLLFDLIAIVSYLVILFVLSLIFKDFILANENNVATVSSIITIVIVYILFSFNRVYFYFVAEKHIGHRR